MRRMLVWPSAMSAARKLGRCQDKKNAAPVTGTALVLMLTAARYATQGACNARSQATRWWRTGELAMHLRQHRAAADILR